MKILERLRKVVAHFDKKETKTFIIDVVPRNIRSNTVSRTDISTVSDMMSSKFEIMEIQPYGCFFPTEWEVFCPLKWEHSISQSSYFKKNPTTKIHVFFIL